MEGYAALPARRAYAELQARRRISVGETAVPTLVRHGDLVFVEHELAYGFFEALDARFEMGDCCEGVGGGADVGLGAGCASCYAPESAVVSYKPWLSGWEVEVGVKVPRPSTTAGRG